MTQDNILDDEIRRAEAMFEEQATLAPRRNVKLPEVKAQKSFSESEEESGQDSDLKSTLRRLFPRFPYAIVNRVCSAVMVGRVLHDSMLDRVHLTVTEIVEDWDEKEYGELHFMEVLNMVETAFEIGLDSKGRVDAIELHGKASESESLEKLASKLD